MGEPQRGAGRASGVAIPRIPLQVAALIGLSGSCYALSLAAVAGLQSGSDTALEAARQPFVSGVAAVTDGNDRVGRRLTDLASIDERAVATASSVTAAIVDVESRLDRLSSAVGAVDGAVNRLPARAPLPPAVGTAKVAATSRSAHATTGGSAVR